MAVTMLFIEVRSHGVGYYSFSMEEEKRQEQLKMLNKLRDDVSFALSYSHYKCSVPFIRQLINVLKEKNLKRNVRPLWKLS